MLAAGSSVPGLVNASQHPWAGSAASTAQPPVGWEQLKGEEEQGTGCQPLPLGSYSPRSALPAGLPVKLGPQLGLWDKLGKGRGGEIFPHELQPQSRPLATTADGTMARVIERSWN